jgi:hypothetical protein
MLRSERALRKKLAVNKPVARVMTKDVIFDIVVS